MFSRFGKILLKFVLATSLSLVLASVANATLLGDRFDCDNSFNIFQPGNVCDATDVLIGAGVEVSTNNFEVDIDATSITMTNVSQSDIAFTLSNNTIEFTSLDWLDVPSDVITGFILEADVGGFTAGDVTTSDHSVTLFVDEVWQAGDFIKITLETTREVPTPSTLVLFGLGLAGLGVLSRRRKKAPAT